MVMKHSKSYPDLLRDKGYMSCCAQTGEAYNPTVVEQVANCVTHGIFVIPSIVAVYYMLTHSTSHQHYFCSLVYGIALVMLFTVSTTFHVLCLFTSQRTDAWRRMFHLGDRFMIYVFIAASYMPWLNLQDFGDYGYRVSTVVWAAAVSGVVYSFLYHEKYKMLETILYLCLGFLPAVPLASRSVTGMFELACGAVLYIIGVIFFKNDGKIPFAHAIWHIFGSTAAWVHHYGIWTHFYQKEKLL